VPTLAEYEAAHLAAVAATEGRPPALWTPAEARAERDARETYEAAVRADKEARRAALLRSPEERARVRTKLIAALPGAVSVAGRSSVCDDVAALDAWLAEVWADIDGGGP
jgi:regulator of protease activity HflC (stomatin/prohibitin superfamily)